MFVSGWLHEGFGSYNEAFYISGAVAIFSALLLFAVNYMGRRHRDTCASRHRERPGIDNNSSFSIVQNSTPVHEMDYKDAELQPILDEEVASNMCPLHEPFRDLPIVVDRETVV